MSVSRPPDVVQEIASKSTDSLDLFSISQTSEQSELTYAPKNPSIRCVNNAPFFAWSSSENSYTVSQGNCNDWSCPRCGINRAKREYGRIVEGCRILSQENELYFITLTCRGREMPLAEAQENYLTWTNKLLTACRTRARRSKSAWHYVQVTERQKRGHPHSHIISTWKPHDLYLGEIVNWKTVNGQLLKELLPALRSDWFEQRCISAGLGNQYEISEVRTVEGASRYVAKYMFKDSMFTADFPKNWHRVRYSQSFPKLEEKETDAFVLLKDKDWKKLAQRELVIRPRDQSTYEMCQEHLSGHDVLIRRPPEAQTLQVTRP